MSRPLTLARYGRLSKMGFGRGEGATYKPVLRAEDVGSTGMCTELFDLEAGRHIQTLSKLELRVVHMLRWLPDCVQIDEQFALDPERTKEAAIRLGLRHPSNAVMTTDFVVHFRSGEKSRRQPIYVKPSGKLADGRTLELLEIEAAFWRQEDLQLVVVTELELDPTVAANLKWLWHSKTLPDHLVGHSSLERAEILLRAAFRDRPDERLDATCKVVDGVLGLALGSCVTMVRHWLATKRWKVDIGTPLASHLPPPSSLVTPEDRRGGNQTEA